MHVVWFKASDVYKVPALPGIYAWYALPGSNPGAYHAIHKIKRLSTTTQGALQESYTGVLTAEQVAGLPTPSPTLLAEAAKHFSPPIYIGISNNLNRRLDQHVSRLNAYMLTPVGESFGAQTTPDPDTDEESNTFARRLSIAARQAGLSLKDLLIKAVVVEGASPDELRQVESFLNRTHAPLYGVR